MKFIVVVSNEAARRLDRMDRVTLARVAERLNKLASDSRDPRLSAALKGPSGLRKSRVGGWRILFTVDNESHTLNVVTVEPRGSVYRKLP